MTIIANTVTSTPRLILRAEGAAVFVVALIAFAHFDGNWGKFALLFFTPDVFMLGYLINPRLGAALYNFGHTSLVPLAVIGIAFFFSLPVLTGLGVIWLGHVGFDRAIGYGLKYPESFNKTHLGTPFAKAV